MSIVRILQSFPSFSPKYLYGTVSTDTVRTYGNLVIKRQNVETFKNLSVKAKFLVPRLTSFLKELNQSEISGAEKSF